MSEDHRARPKLSIVIPTFQRPPALARCLRALEEQTLPASHLEIIVVDDAGTSSSRAVGGQSKLLAHVHLIRHPKNAGAGAARNTGARAAKAPYVAFIDDDCIAEPEWADALLARFAKEPEAALAGEVTIGEPQLATDRVTQLLSEPATSEDGSLLRAQSANLAVPAPAFHNLGGFDERFQGAGYEDYELCSRWRRAGHQIVAVPEAIVHHMRDTTLFGFWRQHYRYGKGAYMLYGRNRGEPSPSLASTWQRIAQAVAGGRNLSERLRHTGLVGLSQTAMLAGFATARISRF